MHAEGIPGPPLEPAGSLPGAFCLPRGDAIGSGAGFATALAAIAIALHRRGGR